MRTVTVTGTGTSTVAPDSAVVRVAAVARGAGVAEAYDAMSVAAATVVEVAGRHAERHRIGSTGVSVWPWHDRDGQRQGYEARHSYAIGCADLPVAGSLLAELTRAVGDGLAVDGVGLEVTDDRDAEVAAREAAFEDARRRATALAEMQAPLSAPCGRSSRATPPAVRGRCPGWRWCAMRAPGSSPVRRP